MEKYGVEQYKSQQIKEKKRQTNLVKYGVDNPSKNEEIKEKVQKTCQDRYGVDSYSQTEEFNTKIKAKSLETFGTQYPMQSTEVLNKRKQTLKDKYGVDSYSQTNEFKDKTKQTCIEKYGVENYRQLESQRLLLREWCNQNPDKLFASQAEQEILNWVNQLIPANKKRVSNTEIDIYIPSIQIGIEYNGLFCHSSTFIENTRQRNPKTYHLDKTLILKQSGIKLIHIWEHEWKYKQQQVKSFLLSALGKNENKIGARSCKLIWSDSKEEIKKAHELLDSTHIQGHTNSTKYVANAYYNNELVATATFGKHHRDSKTWVLSRFTTKTNYTIQGILSKISKLASRELQSDIISWADYRLSNGNGYEKAGWKFEELLPPDYFYWNGKMSTNCIISKQRRQKRLVNTPEGMTEHEHAKLDGLDRIYDCGKIRYKYEYNTTR
jgi:hypothetical protein